MTSEIPISVLVTVYNRQRYLAECLQSILDSTFSQFEVVVVDDRSSDSSLQIAGEFAARDPRIRVFQNPVNLGDYPNRNRAAELARGTWLKYVDSDDRIVPTCLENMLNAAGRFPDTGLVLSYPRPENQPRPLCMSPKQRGGNTSSAVRVSSAPGLSCRSSALNAFAPLAASARPQETWATPSSGLNSVAAGRLSSPIPI
ncbi:MAG UNVERIFIED_CONTAM: glycosyltransferase [Planctomycetaceae bacterium]